MKRLRWLGLVVFASVAQSQPVSQVSMPLIDRVRANAEPGYYRPLTSQGAASRASVRRIGDRRIEGFSIKPPETYRIGIEAAERVDAAKMNDDRRRIEFERAEDPATSTTPAPTIQDPKIRPIR